MRDSLVVIIIMGFFGSLAVANYFYYGPESAGQSLSYSLVEVPIVYGVYKLIKYLYKKSKTVKAAV